MNHDRRQAEGGDEAVPFEETARARGHPIIGLREQATRPRNAFEQIVVGARVRRVEPRREYDYGRTTRIDRSLVSRAIDTDGTAGHDHATVERDCAGKGVGKLQRLIVCASSAHDRQRTPKIWKPPKDAEAIGRIDKITEPEWVVLTSAGNPPRPPQ